MSYQQEIITDSLDYTIVKYLIRGEIKNPVLALDISSLICYSPQSAIYQWGSGALPNLPPLITKTKQNSISAGKFKQEKKGCCGRPETGYQNDLVGFYPPNFPYNQQVPIISGSTLGSSQISYLVIPENSLQEVVSHLDSIPLTFSNQGSVSKGNWKSKTKNIYQFHLKTQDFHSIDLPLKVSDVLHNIQQYRELAPVGQYQYSFHPRSKYLWKTHLAISQQPKLQSYLQEYGWTSLDNTLYQKKTPKKRIHIASSWESIAERLQTKGWETSQQGAYLYNTKERILAKDIASGTLLFGKLTTLQSVMIQLEDLKIEYTLDTDHSLSQTQMGLQYDDCFMTVRPHHQQDGSHYLEITANKAILQEIGLESNLLQQVSAVDSIEIEITDGDIITQLTKKGWTFIYRDNLDSSIEYYYHKESGGIATLFYSLEDQTRGVFISTSLECLKKIIKTILLPQRIRWKHVERPQKNSTNNIQIVPVHDRVTKIAGPQTVIATVAQQLISLEESDISLQSRSEELQMLQVKINPTDLSSVLGKGWRVYFENHQSDFWWATYQDEDNDAMTQSYSYLQIMFGKPYTQIWGNLAGIQRLETSLKQKGIPIASETMEVPSSIRILELDRPTENSLHSYQKEYQVIGEPEIIQSLAQSQTVGSVVNQPYVTCQIEIDADTFLSTIGTVAQYSESKKLGLWRPAQTGNHTFTTAGLYRFYQVNPSQKQNSLHTTPTHHLFEFYQVDAGEIKQNSSYQSRVMVTSTKEVIQKLIYPLAQANHWKVVDNYRDTQLQVTNQYPLIFGKVVGFTGCVSQTGPAEPPIIGIETISSYFTGDNENSAELLWEVDDGRGSATGQLRGETVFVFSGQTQYGRGGLGASSLSPVANNSGQPLLVNRAMFKTGNVLLKTNGSVNGTLVVTYRKAFGWFNDYRFFDIPTDNLQQAIQAQEFIYRDFIRGVKQIREDNLVVPFLINQEIHNRDPLRPGPWEEPLIIHTVSGSISLFLNSKKYNPVAFIAPLTSMLSRGTGVNRNTISVELRNIIEPTLVEFQAGKKTVYNYQYSISVGENGPVNQNKWYQNALRIQNIVNQFVPRLTEIQAKIPALQVVDSLEISSYLSAYAINKLATINLDYSSDAMALNWLDRRILENLFQSESERLNTILIPGQPRIQSIGALHQVGGINTANQSRWLEKQVKRLLYGSETPIPILLPDEEHPEYRFLNGDPVAGFWINAFGTGVATAVDPKPPLIIPEDTGRRELMRMVGQPGSVFAVDGFRQSPGNAVRQIGQIGQLEASATNNSRAVSRPTPVSTSQGSASRPNPLYAFSGR